MKQELTETQFEIVHLLWREGPMTVTEIWDRLRQSRPLARTTIQTWLSRLEKQKWLSRTDDEGDIRFKALREPQVSADNAAERVLRTLFQGSPSRLVMSLAGRGHLTTDEISKLKELLAELEDKR